MRALRLHGPGDIRLDAVPEPAVPAGHVLVEVEACGVCGSDLHFLDGSARTEHVPITLGHEVAGRLVEGGDPVVLQVGAFCGECARCREGRPNLCERATILGIGVDGGLADLIVVPEEMVLPRPEGLSPEAAATAVDAGATAFHAVSRTAGVTSGTSVLVIGVGGLGGYGVQLARHFGAGPVIAADIDVEALAHAKALGADDTILIEEGTSVGRSAKLLTDGGVDVAIEFVGRASTVDAAVKSLRPGGRAVAVGVGIEPVVTVPPVLWSNNEYTLTGSYGSLPGDTEEVLGLLAAGALQPPELETVTLGEAADRVLQMSRTGTHRGRRLVVNP